MESNGRSCERIRKDEKNIGKEKAERYRLGKNSSQTITMSIFFFNDTATTEIYTLSLHDALPILPAAKSLAVSAK